jgi:3-deoxy-7-phosphoheptulonate synthase
MTARLGVRGILIDCSHGNSRKDPARQADVLRDVVAQLQAGATGILGVMIESHLRPGRQEWKPGEALEYGVSITDGCIGFDETEALLRELASAVRAPAARRAEGAHSNVA